MGDHPSAVEVRPCGNPARRRDQLVLSRCFAFLVFRINDNAENSSCIEWFPNGHQ
jgi:hypothetical protein